jgi:hypothetical protein
MPNKLHIEENNQSSLPFHTANPEYVPCTNIWILIVKNKFQDQKKHIQRYTPYVPNHILITNWCQDLVLGRAVYG